MRTFQYRHEQLCVGSLPLAPLAQRFGTPLYIYDFDAIAAAYQSYDRALAAQPHLICAAVKANGNLALLQRLARWGSGFDVVSGGELERVLHAGGRADRVVFSGVGKTAAEIDFALHSGILLFNVESEPELQLLRQRAERLRLPARFGLRVNPDIAAPTHPHIATGLREHKFGIVLDDARRLYLQPHGRWLQPAGMSCHIGSQILDLAPFEAAARRIAELVLELESHSLRLSLIDLGGGLGISYRSAQRPPSVAAYTAALRRGIRPLRGPDRRLLLEPGRSLTAAAGVLLARILYIKQSGAKRFVILDTGSNDLMRPSLYGAYHEIVPCRRRRGPRRPADIVGPICESGDRFAADRPLPPVEAGDLVAILDTGAYGYSLSSNYNARPRPAELAVEAGRVRLIRRRETAADLMAADHLRR